MNWAKVAALLLAREYNRRLQISKSRNNLFIDLVPLLDREYIPHETAGF
jgi:hypothetical protein